MSGLSATTSRLVRMQAEIDVLKLCVTERDEALAAWEFWRDTIEHGAAALNAAHERIAELEGEIFRMTNDCDTVASTEKQWADAVQSRDQVIEAMTARIFELTPRPGMLRRFLAWARRPL